MSKTHPLADLTSGSDATVYTMAAGRPFLRDLADVLLARYRDNPVDLADVMIFLPTRRAARALGEAFLAAAGHLPAATLLPRIRTLGDVDEDDLWDADPQLSALDEALLPPVSALERRLVLARFVQQSGQWGGGADGSNHWVTALHVADELAALLDSFYTEQVSFDRLSDLVPEQYAKHWNKSVEFLEIITKSWPAYLAAAGRSDPADHRRQLIDTLIDHWDVEKGGTPPPHPVIIAGSTGSMPAVARLMRLVAHLAHGCVLLPGLDTALDEGAWGKIKDPHPQAGFMFLLAAYFPELSRQRIAHWPSEHPEDGAERQRLLSLALRPADATDDWHQLLQHEVGLSRAVENLSLIEAADEALEAQSIALAMREALNVPGKRTILVTPDRVLARRVSTRLARWGIRLDDSGGVPFANTLRGNFLRLVAHWLGDVSDPVALLTLLKHPLCLVGYEREEIAKIIATLDLSLRGLRPGPGFDGLRARLSVDVDWESLTRSDGEETEGWREQQAKERWEIIGPLIDRLEELSAPFFAAPPEMRDRFTQHMRLAEKLAADEKNEGASILWAYEDGEAGASLMARLFEHAALLPPLAIGEYAEIFTSLISGAPVRLRGGTHPRLMILGPLEARLQQADLMILGGLNEGSWPDESRTDPFLSRPMRKELGLPSHERRIGLSAHDFSQNASAPEVILTRAKRVGRSPAKPSRWIIRLKNILKSAGFLGQVDQTAQYEHWAKAMDAPGEIKPARAPMPCPPLERRPKKLAVTAVEKLLRDPYGIFARYVLGLNALDDLNVDPDVAIRGRFYHSLFAQFALDHPTKMPEEPMKVLHAYADRLFERTRLDATVQAFWQIRMEESFQWFITFQTEALAAGKIGLIEKKGDWTFPIEGGSFTLEARADRIDVRQGQAFIFDYKTGRIPSKRQSKTFSPQLQLTALIAEQGGFADLGEMRALGYAYLKVLNRKKPALARGPDDLWCEGEEMADIVAEAREKFMAHLAYYNDPSAPYSSQPRPFFQDEYGQYDNLARRDEWAIEAGDDE